MNQATPQITESPDIEKTTIDKVGDILERIEKAENPELAQQQLDEQPQQEVESSEGYEEEIVDEPSEVEETEEVEFAEEESDPELYEDEHTDNESESDFDERFYTVKVNGVEEQVTEEELLNGYSRTADYTKKSQRLAEDKKTFESERQDFDFERNKVIEERNTYSTLLTQMEEQLNQFSQVPEPDWDSLYQQDPVAASREQHDWNKAKQVQQEKLQAVAEEKQRLANEEYQDNLKQYQKILHEESAKLPELIPEWSNEDVAAKGRIELKEYLVKQGVTPEELNGLVKANHVAILYKAMQFDKGKNKTAKRRTQQTKNNGTKVLKSGNRKPPKAVKSDKYKKATSRLKKGGKWQDAHQAVTMLLNE